jgi:A/G-specific adenine glycosylase
VPETKAPPLAPLLLAWYRRNRRDLPWRRTSDPYRIWVSEVMLQQTTVRAVVPYYRRFLRRFPTIRALDRSPLPAVLAAWSGLGYYRRARHLHAAARLIVRRHGGRFPERMEDALALPGIGRYTAGAILSIAFGQSEPVVDGNVARVLARVALVRGDPRAGAASRRLWSLARALVENAAVPGDLNQALMELGATVCAPATPDCGACPVARFCAARAAGLQTRVPAPRRQRRPVTIRTAVALVERGGRLLMRRRNGTGLMDGLWEFPPLAPEPGAPLRLRPGSLVATLRHAITFRRLLVQVHRAELLAEPRGRDYRWVSPRRLRAIPASSLAAKVAECARRRV